MRLGFVTNIPNPYNESLFTELRALGHSVTVLYARTPSAEGREWHVTDHGSEHLASSLRQGHVHVRALFKSVDAVIVSGSYIDPMAIEALLWGSRRGHPVLFWGEPLRNDGWRRLIRRGVFRRLDGVLTVGRRAEWGYRRVAPRACPLWNFPYVAPHRVESPSEQKAETIIGFAGSVIARKGLDLVIEALAELDAASRPILEVAGSGTDLHGLSELAETRHVPVRWLGFLQPGELRQRQASWSIQVVPSRYDGWGVVVNEALDAGLPVLVSEQTGAGVDLIRTGFNGEVIYSPAGWAPAIRRMLGAGVAAAQSVNARAVGRAVASDRAAQWLVQTLQSHPSSADFVHDAFAAGGLAGEWNRLVARAGVEYGLTDDGWRVAYMGPSDSLPANGLLSACLSGIEVAQADGRNTSRLGWALSRSCYERLSPVTRASLTEGCTVPGFLLPSVEVHGQLLTRA